MIRALQCLVVVLGMSGAFAADPVTLQFDEIRIAPLARVVLGDVLDAGYVLDADVLKDETPITVRTTAVTPANAADWLQQLIRSSRS